MPLVSWDEDAPNESLAGSSKGNSAETVASGVVRRPVTDFFRHVHRRAISTSMERTAIGVLLPPDAAHIDGGFSITFRRPSDLVSFSSALASVPFDFWIKSTGKGDMRGCRNIECVIVVDQDTDITGCGRDRAECERN